MAFHEAWKPAAFDKQLHERIGTSYAANTFLVIRQALRREMLMGLARLWDDDSRTIAMSSIGRDLSDDKVIDELAGICKAQWSNKTTLANLDDIPENERAMVFDAVESSEAAFGEETAKELRRDAIQAIEIISKYGQGGTHNSTLKKLNYLRNEQLAHRQINLVSTEIRESDFTDNEVEELYENTSNLIRILLHVVVRTAYQPKDAANIFTKYSKYFWAAVRGERTQGHPDYMPPPNDLNLSK